MERYDIIVWFYAKYKVIKMENYSGMRRKINRMFRKPDKDTQKVSPATNTVRNVAFVMSYDYYRNEHGLLILRSVSKNIHQIGLLAFIF